MAHVSDFTQEEDKIVLDLINAENGTSFSVDDINISNLQIISGANVSVRLTPSEGTGYGGNQTVVYNRISIQEFLDLYYPESIVLPLGDAQLISDFLPEINAGLGTNIKANQIVDGPIGEWEGTPNETKNVDLFMTQTNLIYHGKGVLVIDGNDIPLSAVVTETVLSGLNMPTIGLQFSVENRTAKHFRLLIDRAQNFGGGNENNNIIRTFAGLSQLNLLDENGSNLSPLADVVTSDSSIRANAGSKWDTRGVFSPYDIHAAGETGWLSNQTPGNQIWISFTLKDLVKVDRFQLMSRTDVNDAPVSFRFQVSEDGETWFTCKEFKEIAPWISGSQLREFNFDEELPWDHGFAKAKMVRIRFDENQSSNRIQIGEVVLIDQYNYKVGFSANTVATASVADPGFGPERVLDGDFGTVWRTPVGAFIGSTLTLTMDEVRAIRRIMLRCSATPAHAPKKMAITYSLDGVNWSAEKLYSNIAPWTAQGAQYFNIL